MTRVEYQITLDNQIVTVSLESESPNHSGQIQYDGALTQADLVRDTISSGYGAFGHIIGETTTPIDLDAVVRKTYSDVEVISGINSYDPGIPKDAVS